MQHTVSKLQRTTTFFFGANEELMGQSVRIRYCTSVETPTGWPKLYTVHEEPLVLPLLNCTDPTCGICAKEVKDDTFISTCGHAFHIGCLWHYFEARNMLDRSPCGSRGCPHGDKISSFSCPVCRKQLKVGGL